MSGDDDADVAELIAAGLSLIEQKRYDEALAVAEAATERAPESAEAWIAKGLALNNLKHPDEALLAFDQALALNPDVVSAWNYKGNTLADLKQPEEALAAFERALTLDPTYARAWNGKGSVLWPLKRKEESLAAFEQALALDPRFVFAWNNKGNVLCALKRPDEALVAYERALALDPNNATAWTNKGIALRELQRFEEALVAQEQALTLNPNDALAWSNEGLALMLLGDSTRFDEAIAAFDRALALDPQHIPTLIVKGTTLSALNRKEDALAAFEQALTLDPTLVDVWTLKGSILRDLKRPEEALAAYGQVLALDPDQTAAWNNKGNALYDLNHREESLVAYDQALALDPNLSAAWINKGAALSALNRKEDALASFVRATELDPNSAVAWQSRASVLVELGRYDEALIVTEEAMRHLPDDANIARTHQVYLGFVWRTVPDQRFRLPDGRTLDYVDFGDPAGIPVVYCHGVPGSRLDGVYKEKDLREMGVRAIAIDRPGMGLSDYQRRRQVLDWPDDVAALMDSLGIERFAVLGVSGGGPYVAACAYKLPERVTSIALVSSVGPAHVRGIRNGMSKRNILMQILARYAPDPLLQGQATLVAKIVQSSPEDSYRAFSYLMPQVDRAETGATKIPPRSIEAHLEPFRQGGRGYAQDERLGVRPWGFQLEDIHCQAYIWHGEADTICPPGIARYLASALPRSRLTIFPGEGHSVFNKHWREIVETLTAQIGETPAHSEENT